MAAAPAPKLRTMWRRSSTTGALIVVLLYACALASPAGGAPHAHRGSAGPVPQGFVGMVVDGPVWPDPFIDLDQQLDAMVASGVQSLRVVFPWYAAQPYKSWSQVPSAQRSMFVNAAGVPTNFSAFDQIVSGAAARGLQLLPVVLGAPKWDGIKRKGGLVEIPRSDAPFAAFVKVLVKRYGPHGSMWGKVPASHRRPIRMWQVWNEPNIFPFWPVLPWPRGYVALLKAAHDAIKSVDPKAKVVLAGMPNFSWLDLGRIYKIRGARALFDVVAVHPYTKNPGGVITILHFVRQQMDRNGDAGKPLIADEISWPSSAGETTHDTGYDFATTQSGQAHNLGKVLPLLVRDRRALNLMGFYYYDWAGQERPNYLAFDFAGLFRLSDGKFIAKPAYAVFQRAALAMEGCRAKGRTASDCVRG
jgi:hypothetical protein